MRRWRRLAAAAAGLAAVASAAMAGSAAAWVAGDGTASAAPAASPGVRDAATDHLTLLGQSSWAAAGHVFRLRLQVDSTDPASDRLQVVAGYRFTTRSGFDASLDGRHLGAASWSGTVRLSALPADPAGGVDVDIPIGIPPAAGQLPELSLSGASAVLPLQVRLFHDGNPVGSPLATSLVYVAGASQQTGFPPLDVSLTVPIQTAAVPGTAGGTGKAASRGTAKATGKATAKALGPARLSAEDSRRLARLVGALESQPGVAVTLAVTPVVAEALANGNATDRATVATLGDLARHGDQVLPATYVPVSIPALEAAHLDSELSAQLAAGTDVLTRTLGVTPAASTWVLDGPVDAATVAALANRGATQLVVPDDDLTALPASAQRTTFARPSPLSERNGPAVTVLGADPGLAARVSEAASPIVAANQLLAELSMIQLETPSETRGVAVVLPPSWSGDPAFVGTLLAGLRDNPLLRPVTASQLFGSVRDQPVVARGLAGAHHAPTLGDAAAIHDARLAVGALASMLPAAHSQATAMARQVLLAESSQVSAHQRQALLAGVEATLARVSKGITLPPSSVTLTSRRGRVPLTVLADTSEGVHVTLRLTSQKLIFSPFTTSAGACQVPTPTSATCQLTLTSHNTTLEVPVEARSSGVFPIDASLVSPDGSRVLAEERDTVHSTAVSGVGVILIVAAALFLGLWWIRDLRHGRRARRLVTRPDDELEPDAAPGLDEPVPDGSPAPRLGGPVPDGSVRTRLDEPAPDGRLPTRLDEPAPHGQPEPRELQPNGRGGSAPAPESWAPQAAGPSPADQPAAPEPAGLPPADQPRASDPAVPAPLRSEAEPVLTAGPVGREPDPADPADHDLPGDDTIDLFFATPPPEFPDRTGSRP